MIIPVRCFTCGKPIGDKWEDFQSRVDTGEDPETVLDDLGVDRYCCRSILVTHVDRLDDVAKHRKV